MRPLSPRVPADVHLDVLQLHLEGRNLALNTLAGGF